MIPRRWPIVLITLLVTFVGIKTTQAADNYLNLADKVTAAQGSHVVHIPAGTYYLPPDGIHLNSVENMVIDGQGAILIGTSVEHPGFVLMKCKNVTLKGFTLDFDPLPFTQGTITAKGEHWLEFEVHQGYPDLTAEYNGSKGAYIFDAKTRLWKTGVADLYPRVEILTPRTGRLNFRKDPLGLDKIEIGDFVTLNIRNTEGISLQNSENIRVEDITIWTAPGAGIIARFMNGNNYFRYTIKRGPRPPTARQDRLLSTTADAFNYAYSRKGPTLEGSDFSFQGDDGVNIHGPTFPVIKMESTSVFWTALPNALPLNSLIHSGDTLRIMSPDNYQVIGQAKIGSVGEGQVQEEEMPSFVKQIFATHLHKDLTYYKIVLSQPSQNLQQGDIFDIPAINGSDYVIRNNYFHDNRGRGLILKAGHGIVENNRFEGNKMQAILIGPEYDFWGEAGWVSDVEIKNNTIKQVCSDPKVTAPESAAPGAISVFMFLRPARALHHYWPGNDHIQIIGNTINGSTVDGIHINLASTVTIENNTILNTNTGSTSQTGQANDLKVDNAHGIGIDHSVSVSIK